jgi:glutathione S-transferase
MIANAPKESKGEIVLYYAPRTRAFTALWLLEELGLPYTRESFDLRSGRHKQADYLAMNPQGKVPTVTVGEVAISETGAIACYLCERFPETGLAPGADEADRAAYLRWLFFSGSCIEPAYAQRFMKWEIRPSSAAWGSYEQVVETLITGVEPGPWLLGERFTAADIVIGSGLDFGIKFGALPKDGPLTDYTERVKARPSFARAEAIEARENERFPV